MIQVIKIEKKKDFLKIVTHRGDYEFSRQNVAISGLSLQIHQTQEYTNPCTKPNKISTTIKQMFMRKPLVQTSHLGK